MKIISTNIGSEKTIQWKGQTITTGIFKLPVEEPIFLGSRGVKGDYINNLKVHGGPDKACYGYGENYYTYWKSLYPDLEWTYGMFGENLTISDVDESEIKIGDIYQVGEAIVQVSQPRQPCNKFAAKFGSTNVIKQFIDFEHPGIYFRVIHEGDVQVGDELKLDLRNQKALSLKEINQLVYKKEDMVNEEMARTALFDSNLSESTKKDIQRHWKL
ncbi:MAG: MOSC domain-containing protein [Cyclobacteriaceae bacterium]|nr:MOSC domain-containing protein [Cyclobacteriaceae bacterium]